MKGQLLQNPEYVARKKKERMKSLLLKGERNVPLSTTNRSPAGSNLTLDTRQVKTVQG